MSSLGCMQVIYKVSAAGTEHSVSPELNPYMHTLALQPVCFGTQMSAV